MVSQVRVVSILMIVYGSLLLLVALLYTVVGPGMMVLISQEKGGLNNNDRTGLTIMSLIVGVLGLLGLTCAILNIVGGIRGLKFRNRTLVVTALFSNIAGLAVVHCALFTIGVAVYGLIVLFDRDVRRAFELGEGGMAPKDILEEFAWRPRYRPRRRYEDDRDHEEQPRRRLPPDAPEDESDRFTSR